MDRASPVIRAIKLTPPRPSACASKATNRRRLCSFRTGAIWRYRLRAARACAARIMPRRYVAPIPCCESPSSLSWPSVAAVTQLFMDGPLACAFTFRFSLSGPRDRVWARLAETTLRHRSHGSAWCAARSGGQGWRAAPPRRGSSLTVASTAQQWGCRDEGAHSSGSIDVRILSRRYSSSRKP